MKHNKILRVELELLSGNSSTYSLYYSWWIILTDLISLLFYFIHLLSFFVENLKFLLQITEEMKVTDRANWEYATFLQ